MVCNAVWQFSRVSATWSSSLVSPTAAGTSLTEGQENENSRKEPFSIRLGWVLKALASISCSRAIFYFCAIFTIFQLQLACKGCTRAENEEKGAKITQFVWNGNLCETIGKSPDLRAIEISQAGDVLNSRLESVLELNLGDHTVFRSRNLPQVRDTYISTFCTFWWFPQVLFNT